MFKRFMTSRSRVPDLRGIFYTQIIRLISMDPSTNQSVKSPELSRPKVGVGVLVTSNEHPGCIVLGKRKNSNGAGLWALPGGHLEFGESWEECGRREILEETGLKLKDVSFQLVVNTINVSVDYHYVTIFLKGDVDTSFKAEPENTEPHKCEGWKWCDWSEFPPDDQLFWSLRDARRNGFNPFKCRDPHKVDHVA